MVGNLIFGLLHALGDIVCAAWHIATRKARTSYSARADISAPRDVVWDLIMRRDTTYAAHSLRCVLEPLDGREDAFVGTLSLAGQPTVWLAYEHLHVEPESQLVIRYLAERSQRPSDFGDDDRVAMTLGALPSGGTRLVVMRELTHRSAATRITAPLGVRQAAMLIKTQAEHESGVTAPAAQWWTQALWSAAAFASFVWMFGWNDALIVMAVIAVHEAGHALAMLYFGLGVRMISFIPFFGGVAAPRRTYENQWQQGVVALMGVGFSLPFTVALVWYAAAAESEAAAHTAALAAFINGFNLLPIPGLDGSVAVQLLLRQVHPLVGRIVAVLFFGLLGAFGVWANDPVVWIMVAFSLIVLVQSASLKMGEMLAPMTGPFRLALLAAFVALCGAYVWAGVTAVKLEQAL